LETTRDAVRYIAHQSQQISQHFRRDTKLGFHPFAVVPFTLEVIPDHRAMLDQGMQILIGGSDDRFAASFTQPTQYAGRITSSASTSGTDTTCKPAPPVVGKIRQTLL